MSLLTKLKGIGSKDKSKETEKKEEDKAAAKKDETEPKPDAGAAKKSKFSLGNLLRKKQPAADQKDPVAERMKAMACELTLAFVVVALNRSGARQR